ncbi:hypothetical protein [Kitasatospora sp. NPDC101183]|uniref:hypothetical protein n=1 Tax=Kitasatospora sp. NPDC101183 TaxID=3364100 RepID=UPI0037F44FD1
MNTPGYLPEERETRAYFYDPQTHSRITWYPVAGWHIAGPPRGHARPPYGLPVLVDPDGALRLHDPASPAFLGIANAEDGRRVRWLHAQAYRRWEQEEAEQAEEAAEEALSARQAEEAANVREKAARDCVEAAEKEHAQALAAVPELLADVDDLWSAEELARVPFIDSVEDASSASDDINSNN